MEHGHANHLSDDWSSTAYWYQKLPTKPFGIQTVEERLPLKLGETVLQKVTPEDNEEMVEARRALEKRKQSYFPEQNAVHNQYEEVAREYSGENILYGKRLREEYDQ